MKAVPSYLITEYNELVEKLHRAQQTLFDRGFGFIASGYVEDGGFKDGWFRLTLVEYSVDDVERYTVLLTRQEAERAALQIARLAYPEEANLTLRDWWEFEGDALEDYGDDAAVESIFCSAGMLCVLVQEEDSPGGKLARFAGLLRTP